MPRPRSEMRRIREVLRLRAELGETLSAVAAGAGLARSTVRDYLRRAAAAGLDARAAEGLSDEALEAALYPPAAVEGERPLPDWAAVDEELRRHKHVTRKLLWLEYKAAHPDGYAFSQFKLRLSRWQKSSGRGLSMRQVHRAGEMVQVDYAGDTVTVIDGGVARQAQIFVACLPCSGLIFAEATWTQGHEDWLTSHIRLFTFLGGVPARVTPDNLKVGITHASYYDPVVNASYAALIKHYETAVVPARVRRPRDKPSVENGVLQAYRWLLAPLRHHQFFSLAALNEKLATLVAELNDKPMAPPRADSRRSLFEAIERAALKRLPPEPYVVGEWTIACTVNVDYHIALERNFYSVPYRLVHKAVDAFLTPTSVQIFHRGERVASHVRAAGRNVWATVAEHMPPAHSAVANQTPERIRAEAAKIGIATAAYVEHLLTGRDHIQQGVRSCLGILRLARQHPAERLEAACRWALAAGAHSSSFVEQLLKSRRAIPDPLRDDGPGLHDNVRGSDYYH
jgi:transposase